MRALIAFDKFKDALSAEEACRIAAEALRTTHPDWTLDLAPLSDGGERFAEILTEAVRGRLVSHDVTGPLGSSVRGTIGYVEISALPPPARSRLGLTAPRGLVAVIGMASASGLELVPRDRRDPWRTTTRGTGELIRHAQQIGVSAVLLGVGGSATNDLGLGALAGLGWDFDLDPMPANWSEIRRVAAGPHLPPIFVACDVVNPLFGERGATRTYGPQKGLARDEIPRLESEAQRMAALLCAAAGRPLSMAEIPGAGAAGGIAFGLMVAAGAWLVPGFDLVADWLELPRRLRAADLVITGEGRFDATSLAGKGPGSLVREARRLGKPVRVFAGSVDLPREPTFHSITPPDLPLPEALARCPEFLAEAVGRVASDATARRG